MKYTTSFLSFIFTFGAFFRVLLLDNDEELAEMTEKEDRSVIDNIPNRAMDLIKSYGYPVEEHKVQSQDGYITTLHRIPHGLNEFNSSNSSNLTKPVVLMAHCMMGSSATYTTSNTSLAYVLANEGNAYFKTHLFEFPSLLVFGTFHLFFTFSCA